MRIKHLSNIENPEDNISRAKPANAIMSDDEVEVECGEEDSGEEDCFGDGEVEEGGENNAERRAHHNALERKRRDHIKDSFEK